MGPRHATAVSTPVKQRRSKVIPAASFKQRYAFLANAADNAAMIQPRMWAAGFENDFDIVHWSGAAAGLHLPKGVPMAFMFENLGAYQQAIDLSDQLLIARIPARVLFSGRPDELRLGFDSSEPCRRHQGRSRNSTFKKIDRRRPWC